MQSLNDIQINSVTPLNTGESLYLKPLRVHYNQNGKSIYWDCLKVHDSVAILIYNITRSKLVFVRQFRPAVYLSIKCTNVDSTNLDGIEEECRTNNSGKTSTGFTLELCAGIVDKNKTVEEIAKEEVLEETGYDVNSSSLKFVSSYRSGIGTSSSLQHLFFCEVKDELRVNKGGGIGNEQIDVIELSIEECKKLLFCKDEEAIESRPVSLLFALSWFINCYLPTI